MNADGSGQRNVTNDPWMGLDAGLVARRHRR